MEKIRPKKNLGGVIRRIFDLQVASTYRGIVPFIKEIKKDNPTGVVLDVGCGLCPYKQLFVPEWNYMPIDRGEAEENFDYRTEDVLYYDTDIFPMGDRSVDLVFHSEVMEHVYDVRQFLGECNRVLKRGGYMVATVPFQARYHYIPYDYWRYTPSSLKNLLEESGFEDIEVVPRSRDICVAGYKVLTVGYRLFFSRSWWRMLISAILAPIWIVALLAGQASLHLGLGSDEDALGYVIRCRKRG